jgi:hypothetical protein
MLTEGDFGEVKIKDSRGSKSLFFDCRPILDLAKTVNYSPLRALRSTFRCLLKPQGESLIEESKGQKVWIKQYG